MLSNSLLVLAAGTAGALLLGYCIYYDRKRRSDPSYKRKVHERREKPNNVEVACEPISEEPLELKDHEMVQYYFQNEIRIAEDFFRQAQLDKGMGHLANAVMVCAQPVALLEAMKLALPERIFELLLTKLPDIQMNESTATTPAGTDFSLD